MSPQITYINIPPPWEDSLKKLVEQVVVPRVVSYHCVCSQVTIKPYPAKLIINGHEFLPENTIKLKVDTNHGTPLWFVAGYEAGGWVATNAFVNKQKQRKRS